MRPIVSTTRTYSAEQQWCHVNSPIFYAETRTLDYSKCYSADAAHPWRRADGKFLIPSGVPVAKVGNASGLDRNLIFPVKRVDLAANVLNTDVVYPLVSVAEFSIGDEINITGGTARAITAIDYVAKEVTVATTIGVAGTAGTNEVFVAQHDTAIGILMNAANLSDGAYDVVTSMLMQGHVYQAIIHNSIIPLCATVLTNLATAGIKMIGTTGSQP